MPRIYCLTKSFGFGGNISERETAKADPELYGNRAKLIEAMVTPLYSKEYVKQINFINRKKEDDPIFKMTYKPFKIGELYVKRTKITDTSIGTLLIKEEAK